MQRDTENQDKTVRYGQLVVSSELTSSRTYTLPDQSGTFAMTKDIPTKTSQLENNSGFVTKDTKDTAGNYMTTSKIFFVGATSCSTATDSSAKTFTNQNCYILNSEIYSNGSKVLTVGSGLTGIDSITFNSGYNNRVLSISKQGEISLNTHNMNDGWVIGYFAKNETSSSSTTIGGIGLHGTGTTFNYCYFGTAYDSPWMAVHKNGYVGIGIRNASPSAMLHVGGSGYFTGSVGIGGIDQYHGLYVSGKTRLAGNVGIGTSASDSYKLYVNGSVNFKVADGMNVSFSRQSYGATQTETLYEIVMKTDHRFYLDTPSAPLYHYNWQNHSDIRDKNIIHNIDIDVESIARAPIFDFSWKGEKNGIVSVGTSAQYWEPLLPNAVTTDGVGKLYMDYSATALAAAVMTARKVMDHEEQIAAIMRRLSDVEEENKAIRQENQWLKQEIELLKAA